MFTTSDKALISCLLVGNKVGNSDNVSVRGWVNKMSDFNMGDCCLFPVSYHDFFLIKSCLCLRLAKP